MREYLKKLGRTKFQAFLIMTFTNIATMILVFTGTIDIDDAVNKWLPAINITAQVIVTWLYVWVEGGIDKEAQKAQQGGGVNTGAESDYTPGSFK
jgi:hypothetical protein